MPSICEMATELVPGQPNHWKESDNQSCVQSNKTQSEGTEVQLVLVGIVLGWISALTILMNVLVLYILRRERSLHTVGNMYIASLAGADFLIGSVVMPLALVYLLAREWKLGQAACKFWLSVDYVASTASIFSLFILCLDRYRSVQQPLAYIKQRTKARAACLIGSVWLISMIWLFPILSWPQSDTSQESPPIQVDQCDTEFRHCSWFKLLAAFLNFYIPSALMLWYYSRMYLTVQRCFQRRHGPLGVRSPASLNDAKGPLLPSQSRRRRRRSGFQRMVRLKMTPLAHPVQERQQPRQHQMTWKPCSKLQKDSDSTYPASFSAMIGSTRYTRLHGLDTMDEMSTVGACQDLGNITDRRRPQTWHLTRRGRGPKKRMSKISHSELHSDSWKMVSCSSQRSHVQKDRKAAKQLGAIILVFMACWVPYFTTFTVTALCDFCISPQTHMVTIWLGYLNSTLNPFIYPLCNSSFRKTFRHLLGLQR
ncbi:histamine H1 receptor-like [Polypterus senegalus]